MEVDSHLYRIESKMNQTTTCLAVSILLLLQTCAARALEYRVLHSFSGTSSDGANAYGSLIADGSRLYGMTTNGGSYGSGTVFGMNTNGSGYAVLHSFNGNNTEGAAPLGSLALSGSTLYGMTGNGGKQNNSGTVFSMSTNGTGFQVLHTFYGGSEDGKYPTRGLTLDGSVIYGTTQDGGIANKGTIFVMNSDGSGFHLIHSFQGGSSDGDSPNCNLLLSGTKLYGTTFFGGTGGYGTIFSVDTDGNNFQILHSLRYTPYDGTNPLSSLIVDHSLLYGTTQGTVFRLGTDGSGYSVLHTFNGQTNDGNDAIGSPILSGSTLYGTTVKGGSSPYGSGTVFSIDTDGSDFTLLHKFAGAGSDGANPNGDLTLVGSTLYGLTAHGGTQDYGTIFALTIPEPSTFALLLVGTAGLLVRFVIARCRR